DDVEPFLPLVAAGREDHASIGSEVDGLLLVRARGEVEGLVQPDGDERRDMRPTVGSHGRDPEQLGLLENVSRLVPTGGDGVRITEARVELRVGTSHSGYSSFRQERGSSGCGFGVRSRRKLK